MKSKSAIGFQLLKKINNVFLTDTLYSEYACCMTPRKTEVSMHQKDYLRVWATDAMINHRGVFIALEALLPIFSKSQTSEKPEHPQD